MRAKSSVRMVEFIPAGATASMRLSHTTAASGSRGEPRSIF